MRSFFARLDEKHKLLGNFEKILKFFDTNSLEKLNFLFFIFIFFENQNFFRFRGGISPLPPLATPLHGTRTLLIFLNPLNFLIINQLFLRWVDIFLLKHNGRSR